MIPDARTPVIVGVGELADRPADVAAALDPAGLMAAALARAEADAGAALIARLDRLDIINEISWPYPDPCDEVRRRLGRPNLATRYHPVGGQTPVLALHEAALAIAAGECEAAAVCGAEAEESVRRAARRGVALDWPAADPHHRPVRGADYQSPLARALELTSPVNVYPLYENAARAAWGQTLVAAQRESAALWARNAAVARERTAGWIKRPVGPDDIMSGEGGNRLLAWPYRKLMVANPIVNQGAAVIVTSMALARSLGVDDTRMIFFQGGSAADEPRDILAREGYARSRAMEAVLASAAALVPDGFDAVELYSCFPVVPKMARRALTLPEDAVLTVAGGLTFFGAPLNDYMTHAAVAMVERLRAGGGTGLLYAQGEYVTKHHALVLGSAPGGPLTTDYRRHDVEERLARSAPPLAADHRGTASIETHTVLFDRDEQVRHGVVVLKTPAGERTAARSAADDAATLALLRGEGAIVSTPGMVSPGADGVPVWSARI